uniref:Cytochrome c domain-containing protein n=1 Tax=Parascaris univalens TaxID=6257 RepID=A0A915AH54_PARUN
TASLGPSYLSIYKIGASRRPHTSRFRVNCPLTKAW